MGKTERSNGAFGKNDIEGKAAMVAASKLGSERVSNGREHMSQCGQRASFNGAAGLSDRLRRRYVVAGIEGPNRTGISCEGSRERVRAANEFQSIDKSFVTYLTMHELNIFSGYVAAMPKL
jgi:hypothetical protein